jgi:short-subunit dehydrogenase
MEKTAQQPLVVLTGAGGGVAPSVARRFAGAGCRLALITRPGTEAQGDDLVQQLSAEHGPVASVHGIDLAASEAAGQALRGLEADLGPVHALLNLAGGFATGKASQADPALLERMLNVNLRTAVNATQALLSGMLQRESGFVAMLGANAVLSPAPGMTAYAAAKGALATYTRSLAAEVGKAGVNVALVIPGGAIDTPENRASMKNADFSAWLDPAALADALHYLATLEARGRVHELVLAAH